MLSVTVDQVLSWEPCSEYTRERIEEYFAGKETVNSHDVLEMTISDADKLWAVLREDFIPAKILHEFACWVASIALHKAREVGFEPDERSWRAVSIKQRWLGGEVTEEELAEARAAAGEAWEEAWAAAWAAAAGEVSSWVAARAAAWAAAAGEVSSWVAARAAACAAVEAGGKAAEVGAWTATRTEQIEILKTLLREGVNGEQNECLALVGGGQIAVFKKLNVIRAICETIIDEQCAVNKIGFDCSVPCDRWGVVVTFYTFPGQTLFEKHNTNGKYIAIIIDDKERDIRGFIKKAVDALLGAWEGK